MKFLIVNDDGIESEALKKLIKVVDRDFGYCYLAIPSGQESAKSHAITTKNKITFEEITPVFQSEKTIIVNGYPSDCVRVALNYYKDIKFDMVISGLNQGENLGYDLFYSGTVAAAREGCLFGIPSIAISASEFFQCNLEKDISDALKFVINNKLYEKSPLLNINVALKAKGIKIASQGQMIHRPILTSIDDNTYELRYSLKVPSESDDKDQKLYNSGYTTITPLTIDQSDYKMISLFEKDLNGW